MAILTERVTWRREASPKRARSGMTREAQANVMAALRVLCRRFGSWAALAEAMGTTKATLQTVRSPVGSRRIGAGLALRAARVAGVPVDDILTGAWPRPGACPCCGRS